MANQPPKSNPARIRFNLTELERRDVPGSFLDLVTFDALGWLSLQWGVTPPVPETVLRSSNSPEFAALPTNLDIAVPKQSPSVSESAPSVPAEPVGIRIFDLLADQPDPLLLPLVTPHETHLLENRTLPDSFAASHGESESADARTTSGSPAPVEEPTTKPGVAPVPLNAVGPPGGGGPRVVSGGINAVRTDGQGEENDGWVSVNNDNDNYNFSGDPATSLDQIYDLDEEGSIAGEDDLIALAIHPVVGAIAGDTVSVLYDSPRIALWGSSDKSSPVLTSYDATQMNYVWAEGRVLSEVVAGERVELWWKNGMDGSDTKMLDVAFLTVYKVDGALNVPSYSRHTYIGSNPGKNALEWGEVSGGSDLVVSPSTTANGITTNNAAILWGEGGALGTVKATASPGFSKIVGVNVVKIQIDGAGGINTIDYTENRVVAGGFDINSSSPPGGFNDHFMHGKLRVVSVDGVGPQKRGERFMSFGWMQTVTQKYRHADFHTLQQVNIANVEGKTYKDSAANQNNAWMVTADDKQHRELTQDGVAANDNITLETYDSPGGQATNTLRLQNTITNVIDGVDFYSYVSNFMTYLGVQTRETANSANLRGHTAKDRVL